ncbi:MAG: hypothetical protein ABEH64_01460 [Salinirussus sp.]
MDRRFSGPILAGATWILPLSGSAVAATTPSETTAGVASEFGVGSVILVAIIVIGALWYWRYRRTA